jgi:hypothetical protein
MRKTKTKTSVWYMGRILYRITSLYSEQECLSTEPQHSAVPRSSRTFKHWLSQMTLTKIRLQFLLSPIRLTRAAFLVLQFVKVKCSYINYPMQNGRITANGLNGCSQFQATVTPFACSDRRNARNSSTGQAPHRPPFVQGTCRIKHKAQAPHRLA